MAREPASSAWTALTQEALSPGEFAAEAGERRGGRGFAARRRHRGHRRDPPGRIVPAILLYAADLIIVGATSRGRVVQRVLGTVPLELVSRSRRPVLVVAAPQDQPQRSPAGDRRGSE
jgi:nucleotide-binding universal stress UspA family protein